jgi:hypothetical protein
MISAPETDAPQGAVADSENGGDVSETKPGRYWGEGRLVVRRPESRPSEMAKRNVIHNETDMTAVVQSLGAVVAEAQSRTPEERNEQIRLITEMEQAEVNKTDLQ